MQGLDLEQSVMRRCLNQLERLPTMQARNRVVRYLLDVIDWQAMPGPEAQMHLQQAMPVDPRKLPLKLATQTKSLDPLGDDIP